MFRCLFRIHVPTWVTYGGSKPFIDIERER